MQYLPRGRYCSFDPKTPTPWGICDRTGFRVNRYDATKELQLTASGPYWPGFYIHKDYHLGMNEQFLIPHIKADPYPVEVPLPNRYLETII